MNRLIFAAQAQRSNMKFTLFNFTELAVSFIWLISAHYSAALCMKLNV